MRVVFQLRPGAIRPRSFTGALQALMNAASPTERWRVYQETDLVSFDNWRLSVDRVVRFRARLERPNPHYADRGRVRDLVEGANARMAEVAWTAAPEDPQGLDTQDSLMREAIEHARNHGRARAVGERRGAPTTWDSTIEGSSETRVVLADVETREVHPTDLRAQLGDASSEE